jgi:hypothetical protein
MDKNPFSLYDFLGYVIPGGIALIFAWLVYHPPLNSIADVITIDDKLMNLMSWNNVLVLLLISYLTGHFIAYFSSLTIEKFALWHYQYPSKYLMGEKTPKSGYFKYMYLKKDKKTNWKKFILSIWKIVLAIILLPISILSLIIGRIFNLNGFVVKPLDEYLQKCVETKTIALIEKLNLPSFNKNETKEVDYLRIIYHYEYEKNIKQSKKMDNYVALYGFLRSVSLIFVLLFDFLLYKSLLSINFSYDVNQSFLLLMLIVGLVSYIFYLGFMKFYRRYTLECYMALITDESLTNA